MSGTMAQGAPAGAPSARLIADAQATGVVVDAAGRRLELRRMTALDKLRLFKAAGPDLAQNQPWLGMAVLACSVTAVDGVPVPMPVTEAQIETLIARLGDEGIGAVAAWLAPDPSRAEIASVAGN